MSVKYCVSVECKESSQYLPNLAEYALTLATVAKRPT